MQCKNDSQNKDLDSPAFFWWCCKLLPALLLMVCCPIRYSIMIPQSGCRKRAHASAVCSCSCLLRCACQEHSHTIPRVITDTPVCLHPALYSVAKCKQFLLWLTTWYSSAQFNHRLEVNTFFKLGGPSLASRFLLKRSIEIIFSKATLH